MKLNRKFLAAAGCAGVLAFAVTGCAGETVQAGTSAQTEAITEAADETVNTESESKESENSEAESAETESTEAENEESGAMIAETICVWGPVVEVRDHAVVIDNQSGTSFEGEIVLLIAEETRILDAVNGLPAERTEIEEGEVIYANIGMAMTMSLPPQTTAEAIICEVPQDFKAPAYVQVVTMEQEEGENYTLTASNGVTYQVPADCEILPYLTRNIVTLEDVTQGRTVLVWSNDENQAEKLVLFAE